MFAPLWGSFKRSSLNSSHSDLHLDSPLYLKLTCSLFLFPPGLSVEHQGWAHGWGLHCCVLSEDHLYCCCTRTQGKVRACKHTQTGARTFTQWPPLLGRYTYILPIFSQWNMMNLWLGSDCIHRCCNKGLSSPLSLHAGTGGPKTASVQRLVTPSSSSIYISHIPLWNWLNNPQVCPCLLLVVVE